MANWRETDILRPLRDDEIVKMISICAANLPMSVLGHNFLRMHKKMSEMYSNNKVDYEQLVISDYMRREIYTNRNGVLENCTFVSISRAGNYSVFVYSNDEDELYESLVETKLIDYSLNPYFISVDGRHRPMLAKVFEAHKINIHFDEWYTGWIIPKTKAMRYKYDIPDDVIEEKLRVEDVDIIDKMWPHRYTGSLEYLKTLVGVNESVGIFSRDGRQIRAWAIMNEHFGVGMVHTLPEYRGKGYAKIVSKSLSKTIASKYDVDVQLFVFKGNTTAEEMFKKMGFQLISMSGGYVWVFTKPLL